MERFEPLGRTMSRHKELLLLINLIYEAALDSDFWPSVLMALADAVGAAQIAMLSMDRRANVVSTFAPRLGPDLLASWQKYWAFPVLARASLRPMGEIYTLDSLMPREEFVATRFFNEFWQPAQLGLSAVGANLLVEDQFSALIFFSNAPDKEFLTTQLDFADFSPPASDAGPKDRCFCDDVHRLFDGSCSASKGAERRPSFFPE